MDQPSYVISLYVRLLWYCVLIGLFASGVFAIAAGDLWLGLGQMVLALAFGYWMLFRVAHRLVIEGDILHWFTPLNRGEAPLGKLVSVAPTVIQSVMIFSFRGGRSVQTVSSRGFVGFAHAVEVAAPGARMRLNVADRIQRALPPSEPFPRRLSDWDPDNDG